MFKRSGIAIVHSAQPKPVSEFFFDFFDNSPERLPLFIDDAMSFLSKVGELVFSPCPSTLYPFKLRIIAGKQGRPTVDVLHFLESSGIESAVSERAFDRRAKFAFLLPQDFDSSVGDIAPCLRLAFGIPERRLDSCPVPIQVQIVRTVPHGRWFICQRPFNPQDIDRSDRIPGLSNY